MRWRPVPSGAQPQPPRTPACHLPCTPTSGIARMCSVVFHEGTPAAYGTPGNPCSSKFKSMHTSSSRAVVPPAHIRRALYAGRPSSRRPSARRRWRSWAPAPPSRAPGSPRRSAPASCSWVSLQSPRTATFDGPPRSRAAEQPKEVGTCIVSLGVPIVGSLVG